MLVPTLLENSGYWRFNQPVKKIYMADKNQKVEGDIKDVVVIPEEHS